MQLETSLLPKLALVTFYIKIKQSHSVPFKLLNFYDVEVLLISLQILKLVFPFMFVGNVDVLKIDLKFYEELPFSHSNEFY